MTSATKRRELIRRVGEAYLRDRLAVFESFDAILMGRPTYERCMTFIYVAARVA